MMSELDAIIAIESSTQHLWEKARVQPAVIASGTCARQYYYWALLNGNPNQRMQVYYRGTLKTGTRVEVCLDPYRQRGSGKYVVTRVVQ